MRTPIHTHRHRRFPGALAAVLWVLAAGALPTPARAQSGRLFLVTSGGYDDNILGRSLASTTIHPDVTVASGFGQAAPVADVEWRRGAWSLAASYSFLFNQYAREEAGAYRDHSGDAGVSFRPTPRLMLGVTGGLESFRRTRFDEYDFNHAETSFRVEGAPGGPLTLRGVLSLQRDHYPESQVARLVAGVPDTVDQTDTPTNLELSATVRISARLTGEAGWTGRHTDSNIPRFRYDGHQVFLGGSFIPYAGGSVAMNWLHEWRDYEQLGRLNAHREDDSDTWSLELRQLCAARLTAFAVGSRLIYRSNLEGYGFDQSRLSAGLELMLGRVGRPASIYRSPEGAIPASKAARAAESLAPRRTSGGVRFTCRAPGAHTVTLTGSFNGWSRTAMPLSDTDGDGLWELEIPLGPGTYRYMFYVDSREWQKPEGAPLYEDDGFGLMNGVLVVP